MADNTGAIGFQGVMGPDEATGAAPPKKVPPKPVTHAPLDVGTPPPLPGRGSYGVQTPYVAPTTPDTVQAPGYKRITKADVAMLPTLAPVWQAQQKQNAEVNKAHVGWQRQFALGSVIDAIPELKLHPNILFALANNQNAQSIDPQNVAGTLKAIGLYKAFMEQYGKMDYTTFDNNYLHPSESVMHWVGRQLVDTPVLGDYLQGGAKYLLPPTMEAYKKAAPYINAALHPLHWAEGLTSKALAEEQHGGGALSAAIPMTWTANKSLKFISDMFDTPAHFYRYYESVRMKYGEAAAVEATLPLLAGAGVGLGVGALLAPATGGASEEVAAGGLTAELTAAISELDAATAAELEAAASIGNATLRNAEIARISQAAEESKMALYEQSAARVAAHPGVDLPVAADMEGAATSAEEIAGQAQARSALGNAMGKYRMAKAKADQLFEPMAKVVRPVTNVTGKVLNKYSVAGANVGAQLGARIMHPELWEESRDGTAWAKKYQSLAPTLGQAITGKLGLGTTGVEGFFNDVLSGSIDFINKSMIPDPLGVAGEAVGVARSEHGFKGLLSNLWSGTAMDNVDRAYEQYSRVRRNIDGIVENSDNASKIIQIDQRLAPLTRLFEAARVEKDGVLDVEATRHNIMEVFKQAAGAKELMITGKLPMSSALVYRARTSDKFNPRGLLSHMPMYPDFQGALQDWAIRSKDFRVGDPAALAPLRDGLRQIGLHKDIVEQVINQLAKNSDPAEWMNVYKAVVKSQMQRSVLHAFIGWRQARKLSDAQMDHALNFIDTEIEKAVNEITGHGGITKDGFFGTGGDTYGSNNFDSVYKVDGETDDIHKAAIFEHQLGNLKFINYTEFTEASHKLAKMLNTELSNHAADLRTMLGKEFGKFDNARRILLKELGYNGDDAERMLQEGNGLVPVGDNSPFNPNGIILDNAPKDGFTASNFLDKARYTIDEAKGLSQSLIYLLNKYMNDNYFKPMALATGGWAFRVSASEGILNAMRQGPINLGLAHLAQLGARHERAVKFWGGDLDRRSVLDIASRIGYVVTRQLHIGGSFELRHKTTDEVLSNFDRITKRLERGVYETDAKRAKDMLDAAKYQKEIKLRDNLKVFSSEQEMGHFIAVLHGVFQSAEANILKAFGKQAFMDAAIKSLYLNDGHMIPQMVEGGHLMANDTVTPHSMSTIGMDTLPQDAGKIRNWWNTKHGDPSGRVNRQVRLGDKWRLFGNHESGFIARRMYHASMISKDPVMQEVLPVMYAEYERILRAGGTHEAAMNAAERVGVAKHVETMNNLGEGYRKRYARQNGWMSASSKWHDTVGSEHDAMHDHAGVAVASIRSLIQGGVINPLSKQVYYDDKLFRDMANRKVVTHSWQKFDEAYHRTNDGKKLPLVNFNAVPGAESDVMSKGFSANTVSHIGSLINEKATGRIVTRLSREPVFIVEFAKQRKNMERFIGRTMTAAQADTKALALASQEMVRFIHNPHDKMKFEYGMRVFAPFYFAQNQAWRRIGRLAVQDPGAFEKYVRLMMQAQDFTYTLAKDQNGIPVIPVPGSAWAVGMITKALSGTYVPLGLGMNIDSASTILPWSAPPGAEPVSPEAAIETFLPKLGPLGLLPLKEAIFPLLSSAGLDVDKLERMVLGPVGSTTSLLSTIIPNSILNHIAQSAVGYVGAKWAGTTPGARQFQTDWLSSYVTASNESWRQVTTNQLQNIIDEMKQKPEFKGLSDNSLGNLAFIKFSQMYNTSTADGKKNWQDLMATVQTATMVRSFFRAGVGAVSPLSTQMQPLNAKGRQDWADLINLNDGDQMISQTEWLLLHPKEAPLMMSNSKSISGASWPETQNALKWIQSPEGRRLYAAYGGAARYLMPLNTLQGTGNPYDQLAALYQIHNGMRQRNVPDDMQKQLLQDLGNHIFYNMVVPTLQKQNPNASSGAIYQMSEKWVKTVGAKQFPFWKEYHMSQTGKDARLGLIADMGKMVEDPKLQTNPVIPVMKSLLSGYNLLNENTTLNAVDKGVRWDKFCNNLLAEYPEMSPLISTAFRPMFPLITK